MKKLPSQVKASVIIYFAGVVSFLSKAMWSDFEDNWRVALNGQTKYWVAFPVSSYPIAEDTSPLSSILSSSVIKWIEIVLVGVIFLIWIISFFKIKKIEDKELKAKKIKHTVFAIIVLFVIGILIWLCYRLYKNNMFDKIFW